MIRPQENNEWDVNNNKYHLHWKAPHTNTFWKKKIKHIFFYFRPLSTRLMRANRRTKYDRSTADFYQEIVVAFNNASAHPTLRCARSVVDNGARGTSFRTGRKLPVRLGISGDVNIGIFLSNSTQTVKNLCCFFSFCISYLFSIPPESGCSTVFYYMDFGA